MWCVFFAGFPLIFLHFSFQILKEMRLWIWREYGKRIRALKVNGNYELIPSTLIRRFSKKFEIKKGIREIYLSESIHNVFERNLIGDFDWPLENLDKGEVQKNQQFLSTSFMAAAFSDVKTLDPIQLMIFGCLKNWFPSLLICMHDFDYTSNLHDNYYESHP